MKRSWVLADGDRKKKTSSTNNNNNYSNSSSKGESMEPQASCCIPLSKTDSDEIQGYVDNMNRIKHQTEHICPEVRGVDCLNRMIC